MCLCRQQLDPKSRRIYTSAYFFLFSAILFQEFFEDSFGHRHHALFNGLRFLLFGCAIGLASWLAFRRRRSANPHP